jgi:hypothetical protein
MKPEERAQFILGQLDAGLRTEWSQIEGLEASLEKLLLEAKSRADSHIPPANRPTWEEAWNAVHMTLAKIRGCADAARDSFDSGGDPDVLVPWYEISEHDRELDDLLDSLRVMGREALPGQELEPWYDGWKGLWVSVEEKLSTLRAHIIATRVRLEMRDEFGADKADDVTRQILATLPPDATLEDAEKYAAEYRVAHHEAEEHAEHPTVRDIIRGLFLLPEETPEERLMRDRKTKKKKTALTK